MKLISIGTESDVICLACELSGNFGIKAIYKSALCPSAPYDCLMIHLELRCPKCGVVVRDER